MAEAALVFGVGSSAGLGAALCRRFAAEGLHAFASGRTETRLEGVAREIRQSGGLASAVPGDCTVPDDVVRVFDAVEAEAGTPPRLVVYNTGNNRAAPLMETSDEHLESLWRVCAFGAFLCGREAARRMLPAGGGTLLFTGATASLRARPPFTAFASAKAAERALAQGMAREFGPQGLHVGHVVIDGVIDGDAVTSRFPQIKERLGEDGLLSLDAIADAFWALHTQDRSAWSHELDLRPYTETF